MSWLVMDQESGAVDGYYTRSAEGAIKTWRERYPARTFSIITSQQLADKYGREDMFYLPDSLLIRTHAAKENW